MRGVIVKAVVAAAVFLFATQAAEAQFPLSVSAGPVFATMSGDDVEDESSKTGIFVAVGSSIGLNETFSIEPYLVYVQKGASFDDGDFSVDYIEIPVILNANFPVGESAVFSVGAGPQLAFNISCEEPDGDDCSDDDDLKSTEFGLVAGASIGFPLSDSVGLGLGGGVDIGLTDIVDNLDGRTRTYFLSVGLAFAVGG